MHEGCTRHRAPEKEKEKRKLQVCCPAFSTRAQGYLPVLFVVFVGLSVVWLDGNGQIIYAPLL